tara:strand:+ start:830 stop:1258 length:429 start_codon:yes stop_codon:yes gene_type:complete
MPTHDEKDSPAENLDTHSEGLAERLVKVITERGTTERAVAVKAGVGPTYVRDITHGKVNSPTYAKLYKVAKALDVSVGYLMTGTVGEERSKDDISMPDKTPSSKGPKFTIEGDVVHIVATLDRGGVKRLKGQLDHLLSLMSE